MKYTTLLITIFLLLSSTSLFAEEKALLNKQLHDAILNNQPKLALDAIENGADVNGQTREGSFLAVAASKDMPIVCARLVSSGSNPQVRDDSGRSAVMIAASAGSLNAVKALANPKLGNYFAPNGVSYRMRANVNDKDHKGNSALMYALANEHYNVAEELLKLGADIDVQNKRGSTPLIAAAKAGKLEQVKWLVENGINLPNGDSQGSKAIAIALENNHKATAEYLEQEVEKANFRLAVGQKLLDAIIAKDSKSALEAIEAGANINARTGKGFRLLGYAISYGQVEVVKAMMEHDVNPHLRDKNGKSAVMVAAGTGQLEILKLLTQTNLGVYNGDKGVTFERGSNIHDRDRHGNTALIFALAKGHFECAKELVNKGAKVNVQNRTGYSPLIITAHLGELEQVKWLVGEGADPKATTEHGRTAYGLAIEKNRTSVAEYLKQEFGTANISPTQELYDGIRTGQTQSAIRAIENGAKVDALTSAGERPLNQAASKGLTKIVNAMVKFGGVNPHLRDELGRSGVMSAALAGQLEVVRVLTNPSLGEHIEGNGRRFNRGANVNDQDKDGSTALMLALSRDHQDVAQELLQRGASVNIQDKLGRSALIQAAQQGKLAQVKWLVQNGAKLDAKTAKGRTALDAATEADHQSVVEFLKSQ